VSNRNQPGFFISFEGIDGAGKSTHLQAFAQHLQKRYPSKEVVLTREPGGTPLGEELRKVLLNQAMHIDTEALLMFAARREHLAQVIEPALQAGKIVISDRFTDASFAYQGGGRGLSLDKLNALERLVQGRAQGLIQPNLTFLFDLPGSVAEERRSKARSPDKFEQLDLSFFEKVRAEYLRRAKADPDRFVIIDALQTPELIWKQLQEIHLKY
jgi:dTMP kinase